jgi:hypothetical protein
MIIWFILFIFFSFHYKIYKLIYELVVIPLAYFIIKRIIIFKKKNLTSNSI